MKSMTKVLLPAAAMAFLAACASNWDIAGTQAMKGKDTFSEALKSEYLALATEEKTEADWRNAAYFNNRARAVAEGKTVDPEEVVNVPLSIYQRDIPASAFDELAKARKDLVAVLPAGRTAKPAAAAKAQAMFDCWMEEQEENHQPEHIATCKQGFLAAMKELAEQPKAAAPAPAPKPRTFVVYFGYDSAKMDDLATATVDDILAYAARTKAASLDISGHTDTMGTSAYNMKLAQKRADVVSGAMAGKFKGGVIINSYGESRLAVQTKDNVKEEKNRRVEVNVIP